MQDPYAVLGLRADADAEEIRRAYRRLAKRLHPDLNPGDGAAALAFRELSEAFAVLGDAERRARWDRGERAVAGEEPFPFGPRSAESGEAPRDEAYSELFGEEGIEGYRVARPHRGEDVTYRISVPFRRAALGGPQQVRLAGDSEVTVSIPAGIEDEGQLRIEGQGLPGHGGGAAGDALLVVSIAPHPLFRRQGSDLLLTLPVTLDEAINGGRVAVPTLAGRIVVTVPPGSDGGSLLRIRGRGVFDRLKGHCGDLLLELAIRLPDGADEALRGFIADWSARHPEDDPRRALFAAIEEPED